MLTFSSRRFLIPINAGLIGLLLCQILVHVLIPSDLVHARTNDSYVPFEPLGGASGTSTGHGIQIKGALLHTTHPFHGQRALQTVSTIFFFVDLVLFTVFSLLFILRLTWFRRTAWREILGVEMVEKPQRSPYNLPVTEEARKHGNHPSKHHKNGSRMSPIGELSLWPLGWLTLVAFAVAIIPEREGSEPLARKLTYAAYISWWIGAVWAILTTLLVFGAIILVGSHIDPETPPERFISKTPRHSSTGNPPSNLLFPAVTLSTVAVVGPLLVSDILIPSTSSPESKGAGTRPHLSRSTILPVIVLSFCTLGASLFLSAILFPTLLFTQLFSTRSRHSHQVQGYHGHEENEPRERVDPHQYGLPRTGTPIYVPSKRHTATSAFQVPHTSTPPNNPPSLTHQSTTIKSLTTTIFYFLAAISQSTAAILLLGGSLSPIPGGEQASTSTSGGGAGVAFLTDTPPSALSIPCILFALLLLGISALWFFLGLVCVIYLAVNKQLRWNMGFGHGVILSLATVGLSSVTLAGELNSGFFRVVACVFLGVVVVGFLVNIGFTMWFVATGRFRDNT